MLEAACNALWAIGPAASEAVPALVDLIRRSQDADALMLRTACEVLKAIGPAALPELKPLIGRLSPLDEGKKARIREVIKRIEKKHGKR
jgi:hypothetical protein